MKESENMKYARANYGEGVVFKSAMFVRETRTSYGSFTENSIGSVYSGGYCVYCALRNKWATIVQPKEEVDVEALVDAVEKAILKFEETGMSSRTALARFIVGACQELNK